MADRSVAAPGSSSSIPDLLDRARAGDEAARERLFTACRSYVQLVARAQVESWLRAKVDASDLVQQTLMDAHRGFDGFRGGTEAEWLAWLRRIMQHNAVDFVRHYRCTDKRQAGREVPIGRTNPDDSFVRGIEPSDPGESPSEAFLRHERELEVAEAITHLSPDHQEVILLRNLQRLPFDEIAERMNRSRPAVQMLWMRALQKLEEKLKRGTASD
ncbi:MAG: sigma-70 family RNA polymerase sigma factor [Planctomycetaceae bacterium]